MITIGVVDASHYGLAKYPDVSISGLSYFQLAGRLEAAYVVANNKLPVSVGYVTEPDQAFNSVISNSFKMTLMRLCPKCTITGIPVLDSEIGTTAPQKIVSALQANPEDLGHLARRR